MFFNTDSMSKKKVDYINKKYFRLRFVLVKKMNSYLLDVYLYKKINLQCLKPFFD